MGSNWGATAQSFLQFTSLAVLCGLQLNAVGSRPFASCTTCTVSKRSWQYSLWQKTNGMAPDLSTLAVASLHALHGFILHGGARSTPIAISTIEDGELQGVEQIPTAHLFG